MAPFSSFFTGILGCGLLGIGCAAPLLPALRGVPFAPPSAPVVSVQTSQSASSTPQATVSTTINGKTTTKTINAPYGVETSVVEASNGANTTEEASTTPLTRASVRQMQQQMAQEQAAMQKLFSQQQKMFDDIWKNFPQTP